MKTIELIEEKNEIIEPAILTANTYFWESGKDSTVRRWNEKKNIAKVVEFLKHLNFEIDEYEKSVYAEKDDIEVEFNYRETSGKVYKRFSVYKNGKRSNIRTIRKMYN